MGHGLAWVTDRNRETREEAVAVPQVRGDGDLPEGGSRECVCVWGGMWEGVAGFWSSFEDRANMIC